MPVTAWIGLGSNLDEPAKQIRRAADALAALPDSQLLALSPLYQSRPVGPQDQPDFVNAVAALRTTLQPLALLDALQAIEQAHGRVRLRHWGERTLDLDLLLYDTLTLDSPRLTLPHPRLTERDFVLRPLLDLAPALDLPDGRPLAALLADCPDNALRQLAE